MTKFTAHIINHTHWDREWFLSSVYTNRWIAGLIDRLEELVEDNPDFRFFLDGQTLIIEDLLQLAPQYRAKVERLVRNGNLLVGPYYCQPDWRLACGETLLRNLLFGRQDMQLFEGGMEVGWLVDTFGHISQAPQLHQLFGIHSVYIWRGSPQLEPYFLWRGADGTLLFTINLFGGYRNLYGVTHVPEIAAKRLQTELHKLEPYYPTGDLPLFDGYDLEDNPEDPVRFFQSRWTELPPGIQIRESTPASFAQAIRQMLQDLPIISGELNSGKYAAVFPGTLSARTYLKLMSRDCEYILYQVCEPLGVLARVNGRPYPASQYESWSRTLLQNAVHDCICGVSIDQVHEKMEFSYRQVFEHMQADIKKSLAYIFRDFAPGTYALSTNSFPYEGWDVVGNSLCLIQTHGVGVWEIVEKFPIKEPAESIETFLWKNPYYEARVHSDGTIQIGTAKLGALLVYEERGDTYTEEIGPLLGTLQPSGPLLIEQESDRHCVVKIACFASWDKRQVSALIRLTFDQSPLIRWQIDLDTRGTDFRVELIFETAHPGQVYAGMPFDVVQRPTIDQDLLPRQLDAGLDAVLLGQRELEPVKTFPFQEFVAVSDGSTSAVVLAKGLHSYQADKDGRITFTLHRSVEWLAKPDLEKRVGDAGPFFYVPDARCERTTTHELATIFVDFTADDPRLYAYCAGFQNPPLLVKAQTTGARTYWKFFQENLSLSSMHIANGHILARIFNPASQPCQLSKATLQTDVFGHPETIVTEVRPKSIVTLSIAEPPSGSRQKPDSPLKLYNPPAWRVGPNLGLPDPAIIRQLEEKINRLEQGIEVMAAQLSHAAGDARYHWQHQIYVLQRELLEYRLSSRLNEIKLTMQGQITHDYLYKPDEEIAAIGYQLNQLRIKRRIYDYIIQSV